MQRLLSVQSEIATSNETWLALPPLYALRRNGVDAEYGHRTAAVAITEFCDEKLPGGRAEYLLAVRDFLERIYGSATNGHRYFLEKTPRYHLIAPELRELFPDAKLILLWRNPIAIAASMIDSWNSGNWNLDVHAIDLFDGLQSLVQLRQTDENALSVRYEDLVADPEGVLGCIYRWLELETDPPLTPDLRNVPLLSSLGDRHGTLRYSTVSAEPVNKWKTTMVNPLRKTWARRYLRWIGADRLAVMGYDQQTLLDDLDEIPTRADHLIGDVGRNAYAAWCRRLARASRARRRLPWPAAETGWR